MYSDKFLLDWLDAKSGVYTGKVLFRESETGRGWRLHETSRPGAKTSVREAIIAAIEAEKRAFGACI